MNHQWIRRGNYETPFGLRKEFFECPSCHQCREGSVTTSTLPAWGGVYAPWDGSESCPGSEQKTSWSVPLVWSHMWVGEGGPHKHCQTCRQGPATVELEGPCAGTCMCETCGKHIDEHQGGEQVTFRLGGPGPCPDGSGEFVFCKTPKWDMEKGWVR